MLEQIVHHFYIIEGNSTDSYENISTLLLDKEGISLVGNPDLYLTKHQTMNIEEARALKDFFATKTFGKGKRIAIITTQTITREAQNAMLKLTEEPAPNSHIFFLVPDTGQLIATLLSRAEVIRQKESISTDIGKSFVTMNIPDRMVHVHKIVTKKDKEKAIELINSITAYVKTTDDIAIRSQVYAVQSYITDKSSSIKLLLEHLSLILPISK